MADLAMRGIRRLAAALLAAAVLAPGAEAGVFGDASVPYNATTVLTVDGQNFAGTLHAIPGLQRHDQTVAGIAETTILDLASGRGFFVLPMFKAYVEFGFRLALAELRSPDLTGKPVGRDEINGVATTKYRVNHRAKDGTLIEGFAWLTKTGIAMRTQGSVTTPDGRRTEFAWELSRLELAPQDRAQFDPPEGYYRLPMVLLPPFLNGTEP